MELDVDNNLAGAERERERSPKKKTDWRMGVLVVRVVQNRPWGCL
jgi:hypothetical protein